ncbi:hypothetical protein [Thermococcus piezophilus]|uniref:hypothetical protein n=1 Tax=Thermococcus piezophilus TaxID=1712654 RepID=UPI002D21AF92|nr:hypothetical protein [Thermococcus piezophilus]
MLMSEVIKFNEAMKKKLVHRGDEKAKVTREYLDEIIEKFGEKIRDVKQVAYNQWIIIVEREDLPEIVLYFLNTRSGRRPSSHRWWPPTRGP